MVMTVVTLSKVPPSLRGDLTKWMQEIATGVYIGNFNTRVRELLWERIKQNVGSGEATMSYAYRNELGYQFETYQTHRQNISFEGIPLVMIPTAEEENRKPLDKGYSKAANFRKAKKFAAQKKQILKSYVVIDIETDGLSSKDNHIIEIAAVKVLGDDLSTFHSLLEYNHEVPEEITLLTGITNKILKEEGRDIKEVLSDFVEFVEDIPLVGYNLHFDMKFINRYLEKFGIESLTNKKFDVMTYVKKEKMFLSSYKLEDVLQAYEINDKVDHSALSDAYLTQELLTKVNGLVKMLNREG